MIFYFILINLFFAFLISTSSEKISKKFNLILLPKKNSFHKKKSYLLGGIILFIALILTLIFLKTSNQNIYYINSILIIGFVILAFLDDVKKIDPTKRLIICSLICIFAILFDKTLTIKSLNFYYLDFYYFSDNFFVRYIFPILCIIIFVNAFNFIDGIDGLAIIIGLSILLYLTIKNPHILNEIAIIISVLIFLFYLNIKKSIFLGDSGNYIISTCICCILIKENYSNPYLYFAEEILLLLLIPGLDISRLVFKRILKKKNPLLGDHDHFHHKLIDRFGLIKTLVIYAMFVNLPCYLYYFYNKFLFLIILTITIIYSLCIYKLSKK